MIAAITPGTAYGTKNARRKNFLPRTSGESSSSAKQERQAEHDRHLDDAECEHPADGVPERLVLEDERVLRRARRRPRVAGPKVPSRSTTSSDWHDRVPDRAGGRTAEQHARTAATKAAMAPGCCTRGRGRRAGQGPALSEAVAAPGVVTGAVMPHLLSDDAHGAGGTCSDAGDGLAGDEFTSVRRRVDVVVAVVDDEAVRSGSAPTRRTTSIEADAVGVGLDAGAREHACRRASRSAVGLEQRGEVPGVAGAASGTRCG